MPENGFIHETDFLQISYAFLSDRGKVRKNNEDRLAVRGLFTDGVPRRNILLAVLSDGVGGHQAGEIAAQLGVDTVIDVIEASGSLDDPGKALFDAAVAANLAVLEAGSKDPQLEGMGATLMCALIINKTLHLAYLGDSRAYLLRSRMIHQLNYDHTWLNEVAGNGVRELGTVTRDHPLAHVLSRYLGSIHPAQVDTRIRQVKEFLQKEPTIAAQLDLKEGDRLLLCSDGLTDMMSDEEIRITLRGIALQSGVEKLVEGALNRGGHDNVSVILAEIP